MRQRVLIVEDDALARKGLADLLTLWGYEVATAGDGAEALERVAEEPPAVVVSDLVMPGMDGLAPPLGPARGLSRSRRHHAHGPGLDRERRPGDEGRRLRLPDQAARPGPPPGRSWSGPSTGPRAAREVHRLRRELRHRGAFGRLVAGAPAMQEVTRQIEQVAPTDATVLVLGESGTGKELVARTIHEHSAATAWAVRRRQLRGHSRRPCSRARSSATRRARSRAPPGAARAASSWPTAGRCSSTRSPR